MQIQSSKTIKPSHLKILFWGASGTRKTESVLRYFPNVLHFKTPIADVAKETSGYYLVSYRAEHLTGLRGFQKVEVTLANPEFKVTARKGYRFGE